MTAGYNRETVELIFSGSSGVCAGLSKNVVNVDSVFAANGALDTNVVPVALYKVSCAELVGDTVSICIEPELRSELTAIATCGLCKIFFDI